MQVRFRKGLLVGAVVVAITAALVYGFMPKPVAVEAATVHRGALEVTLEEEGKTWVKDRFVVSAPVAGFLTRPALRAGDAVRRGDVLFDLRPMPSPSLDPRSRAEALAAVETARALMTAAQKQELSAKVESEYATDRAGRMRRLLADGAIAKEQYDLADTEARRALARYHAAQAATRAADAELKRALSLSADFSGSVAEVDRQAISVRAPSDGRVLRVYQESEGVVPTGQPVMEIGDPEHIEVRVELLSAAAVQVGPETPVRLSRWGGPGELAGRVRRVEPSGFTKISSLGVEEQRVLALVDLIERPGERLALGDAFRVEATFVIWAGQDVLQVPAGALFRVQDQWAVFKTDGRRAVRQIVDIGRRNGLSAQILSGLSEGDMVIIRPDDTIRDNSRIKIRN